MAAPLSYEDLVMVFRIMMAHMGWDAYFKNSSESINDPKKREAYVKMNIDPLKKKHYTDPEEGIPTKTLILFVWNKMKMAGYPVDAALPIEMLNNARVTKKAMCEKLWPMIVQWYTDLPSENHIDELKHLVQDAPQTSMSSGFNNDFGNLMNASGRGRQQALFDDEEEVTSGMPSGSRTPLRKKASAKVSPAPFASASAERAAPRPSTVENDSEVYSMYSTDTAVNMSANPEKVSALFDLMYRERLLEVDEERVLVEEVICSASRRLDPNSGPCRVKELFETFTKQPQHHKLWHMILKYHPAVSTYSPNPSNKLVPTIGKLAKKCTLTKVRLVVDRVASFDEETAMYSHPLRDLHAGLVKK